MMTNSRSVPTLQPGQRWHDLFKPFQAGYDRWLLISVIALISVGVVMVASASVSIAAVNYGDSLFFIKRHLFYLGLGLMVALLVTSLPSHLWYRLAPTLLLGALALLVIVLIPGIGREVNGARRWLGVGPFTLQASEVAKFAMLIFMARYLHRHHVKLRREPAAVLVPLSTLVLAGLLLLAQPDFGSAVVMGATVMGMLFIAGAQLWLFGLLLVGAGVLVAVFAVASPYRVQRLITFVDPWADQFNSGYQLTQSLIAFGRGEWLGVGLGNSVQKLFYLPEAHTDFVFSIYAEEFGLVGVLLLTALFAFMVVRIVRIARVAVRRQWWYGAYLAFGVAILMAGQAFINIGVTAGLLPTKGLTLPFISYGGSSLLASCALIATVLRVGMELENPHRPIVVATATPMTELATQSSPTPAALLVREVGA